MLLELAYECKRQQILEHRKSTIVCKVPIQDVKVCDWYASSARRRMGLVFHAESINSERDVRQTLQMGK